MEFLIKNDILFKNQFGFWVQVPTSIWIYQFVDEVTNNLNKNNTFIALFLKLAKAFDTISHYIMLDVLNIHGVRGVERFC